MNTTRFFLAVTLGSVVSPAFVRPVEAKPKPRVARAPRPIKVSFEFKVKLDKTETPHSRVFVRANGKRTLVLSATEGFRSLKRSEFASHEVPREALAACSGWWAGAGDNLYVVRRGARLDVYQQEVDSQAPEFPYRKIKSIYISPRNR